jgi:hypothetical protein
MGEKMRAKILDLTSPGWRERPLMAEILAQQQRIRSDPKIQARRRQAYQESMRFVRLAAACLLLLPILGWSIYAFAAGKPWAIALNQNVGTLYAAWVIGVVVLYAVIARD